MINNISMKKVLITLGFITALSKQVFANENGSSLEDPLSFSSWIFLLAVLLFVLSISMVAFLKPLKKGYYSNKSFVQRLYGSLNDAVPIEHEKDILLDHNYDDIQELDNNLPPWWLYGFYLTIIWSVLFIVHFHFMQTPTPIDEYNMEIESAKIAQEERMAMMGNSLNESNVIQLKDAASLKSGEEMYKKNCAACHGNSAEGIVGPNLTDKNWLHGGGVKNVYKSISEGIPTKGMISWKGQMSASQIQQTASYILSLQGTNPANAKDSQGDEWLGE